MTWISDNAELVLGIAGILGVIAGALIGAHVGLRVERRRQEFERGENDRREGLEMMRAARVLDSELMIAEAALDFYVLERNRLWPDELGYPDGAVWPELRAVVAIGLDPSDWTTLIAGFRALNDGRVFREGYSKRGFDDTKELPADAKAIFESPHEHLRQARAALHDLAYPDHVRLP